MYTLKVYFKEIEYLQLNFSTLPPDFPNMEILGKEVREGRGVYLFILSDGNNKEIQRSSLLDRDSFVDGKMLLGQFLQDYGDQNNADSLFQLPPGQDSLFTTKKWLYWLFAVVVVLSIVRITYKLYQGLFKSSLHNNDSHKFIIVLNFIFLLFMLWGMWVFIIKRKHQIK